MSEERGASMFQFTLSEALIGSLMLAFIVSLMSLSLSEEPSTTIVKTAFSFAIPAGVAFLYAVFRWRSEEASDSERNWRMVRVQLVAWPIGLVFFVFSTDALRMRRSSPIAGAMMCKAIQEAQEIYRRYDYDKDGVHEYSPTLGGLFETTPGARDLALVDVKMAEAESTLPKPTPKAGFLFTVLTAQGKDAPGGAKSYIDANGNMTDGCAVLAYPSPYNPHASRFFRACYMMDSATGTIYMRDFGSQTPQVAPTITELNPDTNWELCP